MLDSLMNCPALRKTKEGRHNAQQFVFFKDHRSIVLKDHTHCVEYGQSKAKHLSH